MRGPIRRRVLVATLVAALVAVVVTTIAALTLVRGVDNSAGRDALAAQVQRLASATPAARQAVVDGLSQLGDQGVLVALVTPRGAVAGSASAEAVPRVRLELRAGRPVSTTVRRDGRSYLVEARPVAGGGGGVVGAQDASTARTLTPAVLTRLAIALAIGIVVALVAALVVARALSRPLVRLAGAARRLADGERDVALEPSGIDEVADVEAALGSLDRALARSEGRQREFLLSISHELRTPLTAIRGYAEALRDGVVPLEQLPEVGRTLEAESTRLTAFTDDLLALARLEADDFPLQEADVELGAVLREAEVAWLATASVGGVEIEVDAVGPVVARTDAARVRQVVDGLLENALRVSPAGSRIVVRAGRAEDGAAIVEVADGGPGLTPDDAAQAFERGRLRDRYRDVRPVGTGLGLSIAARLVERLGGTITAHSTPGGAVFRISLPRAGA
ncbi:HAMP domain-containing sensor histidine kinase [Pseudolysinimonas kribbensis]|uniref:Signal transduction histidine-protein kinase/phosphatase MprB n=1 Tax=Pseudolysinimonas kribbensis TaxID=433641 RepID=A0ABQ6K2J2_9MICO|nr:HAMP domain-containing sensor histidine kinase [Pseudolysinimonas kribbensis]GMA94845.1 two-component sensor histidine kinase [Pseudolysinimonas kribbensis]